MRLYPPNRRSARGICMPKTDACLKRAAQAALTLCLGFVLSLGLRPEVRALYDVKPGEASGRAGSIIRVWPLEGGGPGGGDCLPHPVPLDRPLRRADCRLGRDLHSKGRGSGGRAQRDRLGASNQRRGRGLPAVADARRLRHDLGFGRHAAPRLCGGRDRLSRPRRAGNDPPLSDRRERGARGARFGARGARSATCRRIQSLRCVGP
jgi:hypothetical protein